MRSGSRHTPWNALTRLWRAEEGTSDIEYILLTAMVVLPLLGITWFVTNGNRVVFGRIAQWTHLPYP